ncbi:MAG: hypothetical protein R6X12_09625 [bacterium]
MRRLRAVVMIGLAVALPAAAQVPRFRAAERISSGGVPIDLGYYTAPVMFDWNEDGRKDMVVGQFSYGHIAFFENVGDDSAPEFASHEYLQASGQVIQLPYG